MPRLFVLLAVGAWGAILVLGGLSPARGAPPPSAEQVASRLAELNDDDFETRDQARLALQRWSGDPAAAADLAEAVRAALERVDTPLEARTVLEALARRLPLPARATTEHSPARLRDVVASIDDARFEVRRGAVAQLTTWLADPRGVGSMLEELSTRLVDPHLSRESRREIQALWDRARETWLVADPLAAPLAPATPEQIDAWVAFIVQPPVNATDGVEPATRVQWAERQLLLHLANPAESARVADRLAKALEDPRLSVEAEGTLRSIHDWSRPAMVAEYWDRTQHLGIQHLLIGVPSQAPGAQRPSHFDRIDDQSAHCVSGNTLSPGDYPVGVFMIHPRSEQAAFHLVNLPTARARLSYDLIVKRPQIERAREIMRRTCQRWLARPERLLEGELRLLEWFEPSILGPFAIRYMAQVEDGPVREIEELLETSTSASVHNRLALLLGERGITDQLGPLLTQLETGRVQGPTRDFPGRIGWLGALLLLRESRDPPADLVRRLLIRPEPSREAEKGDPVADIGAIAAAILLERHVRDPGDFELVAVQDEFVSLHGLPPYRFARPTAQAAVWKWFQDQLKDARPGAATP